MADKNPQANQPIKRRTFPSSSAKSHNPPNPSFSTPNRSIPNSISSRSKDTKTNTSVNWDNIVHQSSNDSDHEFPALVGTCQFMCPVEERSRRERLRDLAVFERLNGNHAKTSPDIAVKKFCRTISTRDTQPSDVRPLSVLEETLNYLLNLMHSREFPFEVVHEFIFDRTRSIRQDLSMQDAIGDQVICMYERMVKFHIISNHYLHSSDDSPNIASMCHLNMEQLMKALTTLLNLYEVNRDSQTLCKNEAEFHSIYLLLRMGSNNQGESLSLWFRRIPSIVMNSNEMSFARRILRYSRLGNYKRFIYTMEEEASDLQYCVMEPYINEVRILALSCVSYGGYKLQPYPLVHLSKLLRMKESDVESLCVQCGLEISSDALGKGLLCNKQSLVCKPTRELNKYYRMDSKRVERLYAEL